MVIEIFDIEKDDVISSSFGTGRTDYKFALDKLYGLINQFDAQRNLYIFRIVTPIRSRMWSDTSNRLSFSPSSHSIITRGS